MSHAIRICVIGVTALAGLLGSRSAAADQEQAVVAAAPETKAVIATTSSAAGKRSVADALGVKPIDQKLLATKRGGSDVFSDMQLKGVVADNRAVNVATGNNTVSDGAFAGASGLPMLVQNTGNNVLIQNATIVNVQVK